MGAGKQILQETPDVVQTSERIDLDQRRLQGPAEGELALRARDITPLPAPGASTAHPSG